MPSKKKLRVCMYKMISITAKTWNKAGISVIKLHENYYVNKILLLLLCISDIVKRWGGKNINERIDTEIKGKCMLQKWMNLQNNKLESTK